MTFKPQPRFTKQTKNVITIELLYSEKPLHAAAVVYSTPEAGVARTPWFTASYGSELARKYYARLRERYPTTPIECVGFSVEGG